MRVVIERLRLFNKMIQTLQNSITSRKVCAIII